MKIMVIVVHPDLDNSRANRVLMQHSRLYANGNVDIRDLYKEYPNWIIDIEREQQLLLQYDRVVFQFPFYWYSCPPLLKKWFDDVLTFGWAFGPEGNNLKGKEFMLATTVAGLEQGYQAGGDNWYTASELLRPIQATLNRCKVHYLPAFVTYNVERVSDEALRAEADRYAEQVLAPAVVESRY
jgi:glutathione-regulated potassium-efflux system ancillary protein KefG